MIISNCEVIYLFIFWLNVLHCLELVVSLTFICVYHHWGLLLARNLIQLQGMKLGTRVQERRITFCKTKEYKG